LSEQANVWLAVNAENERATHFYIRNGFEKAGEAHFRIGDQAYRNNSPSLFPAVSDL
jgi:diamine N-acetyltransferase